MFSHLLGAFLPLPKITQVFGFAHCSVTLPSCSMEQLHARACVPRHFVCCQALSPHLDLRGVLALSFSPTLSGSMCHQCSIIPLCHCCSVFAIPALSCPANCSLTSVSTHQSPQPPLVLRTSVCCSVCQPILRLTFFLLPDWLVVVLILMHGCSTASCELNEYHADCSAAQYYGMPSIDFCLEI